MLPLTLLQTPLYAVICDYGSRKFGRTLEIENSSHKPDVTYIKEAHSGSCASLANATQGIFINDIATTNSGAFIQNRRHAEVCRRPPMFSIPLEPLHCIVTSVTRFFMRLTYVIYTLILIDESFDQSVVSQSYGRT